MSTLYENHVTGDDRAYAISMTSGDAQTFTPSVNHIITSVILKLYRGSVSYPPGLITVSIRAVDADTGLPTGADLCSGTTDGDTLTEDTDGEWREISFITGALLLSGTLYAIYAWSAAINAFWRVDSDNGYADGKQCITADGGVTWATLGQGQYDLMFEEWGDPQGSGEGGSIFPSDDVARVSSIRHIFRPGFFRMQAGLGDLGFDIDIAETAVKTELDTAKGPPVSPVTGRPLPTRWPPAPGEFPDPIACPRCGMIVPYLELATHLRTMHPAPTKFPAYEAQIEYEEWFQKQMEELRERGAVSPGGVSPKPKITPEEEAQIIRDIGIRLWNKLRGQQ